MLVRYGLSCVERWLTLRGDADDREQHSHQKQQAKCRGVRERLADVDLDPPDEVNHRKHPCRIGKLMQALPPDDPNRRMDAFVEVIARGTSRTSAANPTVINGRLTMSSNID